MGHIHIGYENPDTDTSIAIIQAMDLFLGVSSILLDDDTERRVMYGKAGAYRFKKYGVEYRTLSNFWIKDEQSIKWAYEQCLKMVEFINSGGIITNPQDIIQCINTCDKKLAEEILDDYNISVLLETF